MTTPVPIIEEGVSDAAVGDVFRIGVFVGVPASFVVIVALGLAAGVSFRQSVLLAVWPALVVGGFFGAQGALARITATEARHPAMTTADSAQREPAAAASAEAVEVEPMAAQPTPKAPAVSRARPASKAPRPRGAEPTSTAAASETPTRRRPVTTSSKKAATAAASSKSTGSSKASSTPTPKADKPAPSRARRPRRPTS